MNIIAITPFTGSEKLVTMTETCIDELTRCDLPVGVHVRIIAVNNGATRPIDAKTLSALATERHPGWDPIEQLKNDKNYGFGVGVNRGIDLALHCERWPCDHLLVFNNDLQFSQRDWLVKLLAEVEGRYVLSPRTDVTATIAACMPAAEDIPATRSPEVSAFCWLVPRKVIDAIESRWHFSLFCPQFTNYGSDDATAAILRGLYGQTPFKVVHRAWVRHLKAQTANELLVKAGTKELLTDLKKWKQGNKLR